MSADNSTREKCLETVHQAMLESFKQYLANGYNSKIIICHGFRSAVLVEIGAYMY